MAFCGVNAAFEALKRAVADSRSPERNAAVVATVFDRVAPDLKALQEAMVASVLAPAERALKVLQDAEAAFSCVSDPQGHPQAVSVTVIQSISRAAVESDLSQDPCLVEF